MPTNTPTLTRIENEYWLRAIVLLLVGNILHLHWPKSTPLSYRCKRPSRIFFSKPKNFWKIYGLAKKPLTIIFWLAAGKNTAWWLVVTMKGTVRMIFRRSVLFFYYVYVGKKVEIPREQYGTNHLFQDIFIFAEYTCRQKSLIASFHG